MRRHLLSKAILGSQLRRRLGAACLALLSWTLPSLATATPLLYTTYSAGITGLPPVSVLATIDPATNVAATTGVIGYTPGFGNLPTTGLAYGDGSLFATHGVSFLGLGVIPALVTIDPATGLVLSERTISSGDGFFGYTLNAMAYGDGKLFGVYQNTNLGFPSVLLTIDPATGLILSQAAIGFGSSDVFTPLQYAMNTLAYGDGKIYGTYSISVFGLPPVSALATVDPLTGIVSTSSLIGYAPGVKSGPTTGLAYVDGSLYTLHDISILGLGALEVLATADPVTGAVPWERVISPLGFHSTGLAYANDATPGEGGGDGGNGSNGVPEPGTLWLTAASLAGLAVVRRRYGAFDETARTVSWRPFGLSCAGTAAA